MKINFSVLPWMPLVRAWSELPALAGWLALCAGICLTRLCNTMSIPLYNYPAAAAIYLLVAFAIVQRSRPVHLTVFFAIGILCSTLQTGNERRFYQSSPALPESAIHCTAYGKVGTLPILTAGGYRFVMRLDSLTSGTAVWPFAGKSVLATSASSPQPDARLICAGHYQAPRHPANPWTFDEYAFASAQNTWGRFRIDSFTPIAGKPSLFTRTCAATRATVVRLLATMRNEEFRGILLAAFLGDTSRLSDGMKSLFLNAGIYHLLALSGFNVGILIGGMMLVFLLLPLPRQFKIVATVAVIWWYLLFTGIIPSLFRATLMASILLFAFFFQRKSSTLNTLGVAGIVWLLLSPSSLFSPGFQLSFAATFGIITLYPRFTGWFTRLPDTPVVHLLLKPLLATFFVSLASFVATLPILLYHFGRLALFGLIANIGGVTLMSVIIYLFAAALGLSFIAAPAALLAMRLTEWSIALLVHGAQLHAAVPWLNRSLPAPCPELTIIYVLSVLGFLSVNRRNARNLGRALLVLWIVILPACLLLRQVSAGTEIIVFRTDEKPCLGIRFPNAKTWIIGTPPLGQGGFPGSDPIAAWMRHGMPGRFDALLPDAASATANSLEPLVSASPPRHVILHAHSNDKREREEFESFLREYALPVVAASAGWKFIPAPECTVTCRRPAGALQLTLRSVTVLVSDTLSGERFRPRQPAAITITGSRLSTGAASFSTDRDNAVRVKIHRNGSVQITTMAQSGLRAMGVAQNRSFSHNPAESKLY
jgi:ComEC/Rec2-related protein